MLELANSTIERKASSTGLSTAVHNPGLAETPHVVAPSHTIWENAIDVLRGRFSAQTFELWFTSIRCIGSEEGRLTLVVPNLFIRDWFDNHYLPHVLEEIAKQTGRSHQAIWLIDDRLEWAAVQEPAPAIKATPVEPTQSKERTSCNLIKRYTFDQFVVGPSNQLAEAASRAVVAQPGSKYNPLFIYGGVGLGKTHLLHAIGHAIHAQHPDWKIVYAKTETFLNEYVQWVRSNRIDEFRAKYRRNVDVLLVDDIQELSGKERTQDEFFHTFNALFELGKQIVVTSDRFPHQINDLEERVRSRFQWGLIADIQPPELETRMAILLRKAEQEQVHLPDDVAFFLATHIKSNVRELEGLLLRLAAMASLTQRPMTVEYAKEALQQFFHSSSLLPSIEQVQRNVATFYRLSPEDITGVRRNKDIARARQIAMYLSRKLCKASYPTIGQAFGKDHTTVLVACRKIEQSMPSDAALRHDLFELERRAQ